MSNSYMSEEPCVCEWKEDHQTQTTLKLVNQTSKPRREVDSCSKEGRKLSYVQIRVICSELSLHTLVLLFSLMTNVHEGSLFVSDTSMIVYSSHHPCRKSKSPFKKNTNLFITAWFTEKTYLQIETYELLLVHTSIVEPITVTKV